MHYRWWVIKWEERKQQISMQKRRDGFPVLTLKKRVKTNAWQRERGREFQITGPMYWKDLSPGSSCLSKNKERLFALHLWRFHKLLLQVLHAAFFSVQRQPGQQPHQASNPKQVKHPLPGQVWANLSHTQASFFKCVCVIIMVKVTEVVFKAVTRIVPSCKVWRWSPLWIL